MKTAATPRPHARRHRPVRPNAIFVSHRPAAGRRLRLMGRDEHGYINERFNCTRWRYLLPTIMLFLSRMMVSEVKYPTFKTLNLRATKTFTKALVAVLIIGAVVILREKLLPVALPVLFTACLIYKFVRPRRRMRREIEDEDDDEEEGRPSCPARS